MSHPDCIGICIMEEGYCVGCGRSEEEIYQSGADAVQEEIRPSLTPPPPVPEK